MTWNLYLLYRCRSSCTGGLGRWCISRLKRLGAPRTAFDPDTTLIRDKLDVIRKDIFYLCWNIDLHGFDANILGVACHCTSDISSQ